MGYLFVFAAVNAIIILHEAGHLLAAKGAGIPVARFSVGFSPRLWGFKAGGTEYRLSGVPFGGYVLPDVEDAQTFEAYALKKRLAFSFGGPLANLLGAMACVSVAGMVVSGISLETALYLPLKQTWLAVVQICAAIPMLFSRPAQMSGIVGIVAVGGAQIGTNPLRLLELSFLLNVNLAVLNLLPIPPLDGAKILMSLLERIYAPLKRLQVPLALTGWLLLLGLMVYVTIFDVIRITNGACA